MWMIKVAWSLVLLIIAVSTQEDSLQSALNAVDRRQRDLKEYYGDGGLGRYYSSEDRDDLAFLKPTPHNEHRTLEQALLNYLENEGAIESEDGEVAQKRFSSSFRERIEKDKAKQREQLENALINRLEDSDKEANEDYYNLIQQLYEKYRGYPDVYGASPRVQAKKRLFPAEYYTNLGYDSVGMKKRSRYFEPDGPRESFYLWNYAPRDDILDRIREAEEENEDLPEYYTWNNRLEDPKRYRSQPILTKKRFPVSKRSPSSVHREHQQHRGSHTAHTSTATDPKVAEKLSTVFGTKKTQDKSKKTKKPTRPVKPKETEHDSHANVVKNNTISKKDKEEKRAVNKEIVPNVPKEKLLQIKKKSIDWSDYFGYDRKKKQDNVDNEWLLERYHKAIAMGEKRSVDHKSHEKEKETEKKNEVDGEEAKLGEIDVKLKNIEDSIVDDALKYTGAHEGTVDSKEIQEIKDKVISRLATAYNLEKMRQAIGEYKESIAKQRKELQESEKLDEDISEAKRVSVPRKNAVDEEREKTPEGDNNIKCSQGDEDCNEQTYRAPSELLEEQYHWIRGECPKIQKACNDVAQVLGNYGHILEPACNMHQACLLCGENAWFAPTRQCNVLFLSKADDLCEGDLECQKIARHSIRYLLDINRSLRTEPDECDLLCPDNRR